MALPKIAVGRFLRKTVAPLIPGGADVAERVNGVIKDVRDRIETGENIIPATRGALTQINEGERKKQLLQFGIAAAAVVLLVFLLRRR